MKTLPQTTLSSLRSLGLMTLVSASLIACTSQPKNLENQAPSSAQLSTETSKLCASKDLQSVNQRALLAGGYYAIASKDLDCAERLTTQARKLEPKDPYAALNLGSIYERQGKKDLAKLEYLSAIALDDKGEQGESAIEATSDKAKRLSPGQIARRNLALLEKQ